MDNNRNSFSTYGAAKCVMYLTLCSVNMTYNLKKSIIQWESVYICICLRPQRRSLSAQCVVTQNPVFIFLTSFYVIGVYELLKSTVTVSTLFTLHDDWNVF